MYQRLTNRFEKNTALHLAEQCDRRQVLVQSGIEPHPGPDASEGALGPGDGDEIKWTVGYKQDEMIVSTINVTSLEKKQTVLCEMKQHLIFIQETIASQAVINRVKHYARDRGWTLVAGPVANKGVGVGVLVRNPLRMVEWHSRTA